MNKFHKYLKLFLGPDGDEGGGPSVQDILGQVDPDAEPGQDTLDPNDDGSGSGSGDDTLDDGSGEGPTPPKPAAPQMVDAGELAKQFGVVLGQHFAKVPAQGEPKPAEPITPEQAKKLLNVFEFSDDFVASLDNVQTKKQALEKLRDGLILQMDTIARLRLQQMQEAFDNRFTPLQSMLEQYQAQQAEAVFDTTYPQLANPALRPLLASVASQLDAAGKLKGLNQAQKFDAIASGVAGVIQVTNPTFKLSKGSSPTKTTKSAPAAQRSPGIATTTSGGGGGGHAPAGGDGTSNVPKAVSLMGKVTIPS